MLDIDEWALSQHLGKGESRTRPLSVSAFFFLVKIKLDGHELPSVLPDHLVPPSKRHLIANETSASKNASLYPSIATGGAGSESADGIS